MRALRSLCLKSSAVVVLGLTTFACGDDTATGGAGTTGTTTSTTVTSSKASTATGTGSTTSATGSSTSASTGSGPACSGATPVALTIKNYISWCNVTVDGNAPVGADQTVCVAAGPIDVSAVAKAGFELGATPWHDTDGDTGNGEQGTITGTGQTASSAAVVTVSGTAACAWVCCETAGMMDCPTTDQCP